MKNPVVFWDFFKFTTKLQNYGITELHICVHILKKGKMTKSLSILLYIASRIQLIFMLKVIMAFGSYISLNSQKGR